MPTSISPTQHAAPKDFDDILYVVEETYAVTPRRPTSRTSTLQRARSATVFIPIAVKCSCRQEQLSTRAAEEEGTAAVSAS
jgi:hypothetical protein